MGRSGHQICTLPPRSQRSSQRTGDDPEFPVGASDSSKGVRSALCGHAHPGRALRVPPKIPLGKDLAPARAGRGRAGLACAGTLPLIPVTSAVAGVAGARARRASAKPEPALQPLIAARFAFRPMLTHRNAGGRARKRRGSEAWPSGQRRLPGR